MAARDTCASVDGAAWSWWVLITLQLTCREGHLPPLPTTLKKYGKDPQTPDGISDRIL